MKPKKSSCKKTSSRTKKPPRKRVERTYNANSMTFAEVMSMIREALRRKSLVSWKPIQQVRKEAQIPYTGNSKRQKYLYVCNDCGESFNAKDTVVHHITEVGSLTCFEDLGNFARNLFCEKSELILLCKECHDIRHGKE